MNTTIDVPASGPITGSDRVCLASAVHGLYLIGMASCEAQRMDEDCAMDNAGVPHRYEDLSPADRAALAKAAPIRLEFPDDEWRLVTKAAALVEQSPEAFVLEAALHTAATTVDQSLTPNLPGSRQPRPVFRIGSSSTRQRQSTPWDRAISW